MSKIRMQSRRAASKEALKQMHLLLDDQETLEITDDDDDDVIEVDSSPPRKKYKVTQKKSSDDRDVLVLRTITNHNTECSLELECYPDKLNEAQLARKKAYEEDEAALKAKLDTLVKSYKATVIHKGTTTTAYESGLDKITVKKGATVTAPAKTVQSHAPAVILNSNATPSTSTGAPQSFQLVMDPRLGLVAVPTSSSPQTATTQNSKVKILNPSPLTRKVVPAAPSSDTRQLRGRPKSIRLTPPATLQTQKSLVNTKTYPKAVPKTTVKLVASNKAQVMKTNPILTPITESNSEGGLGSHKRSGLVPRKMSELTQEAATAADTREIAFNKLQGKTYPSLVVVARPTLRVDEAKINKERPQLDNKVKMVLMLQATKFTEWLIQQGLVRSEQKCSTHPGNMLKLGMYSDMNKFPYSGGYVWISECCPSRFMSVFSGSLFENSPHPPMVILKLIYHWAVQTNIQNVTQWVHVDNLYVKNLYTWLRAVCTVANQTHIKRIGGPGLEVELGIISLGTTTTNAKRQVKVEVLGVLETKTNRLLMRALDPVDQNYKRRLSKILEPVVSWVHPSSVVLTDLTVDIAALRSLGFNNVIQNTGGHYGKTNDRVMDYLRRAIPRMFQNTLSLLSRPIIQQFLDELVWREVFGRTPLEAFDSIINHIGEQTRADNKTGILIRLNKVALNPFRSWAINPNPHQVITLQTKKPSSIDSLIVPPFSADFVSQQTPPQLVRRRPVRKSDTSVAENTSRAPKSTSPDIHEQLVPLQNYYYGTMEKVAPSPMNNLNLTIKCPICKRMFFNNIQLMNHLFQHAHNASEDAHLCRYCLTIASTSKDMYVHIANNHPSATRHGKEFVCLICESQYKNAFSLGKHMSREHAPSELPYQCGTCGFRCSNHKQAVDHFYESHNNGPTIQCPFCLKSTTIYSVYRNLIQNVNNFVQHLQKHQKKQVAKKCPKCSLWFIQKELLRDHIIKMHASLRGNSGLQPCLQKNCIMVPRSRLDKSPSNGDVIDFDTLHFKIPKNLLCKECNKPLDTPKHFPSFASCQNSNCLFSTCCTNAMEDHRAKCKKQVFKIAEDPLPYEMFCVCGFKDTDGNKMARHLTICERKSAYPSLEDAKSACVKNRLLDTLGLVRKPDEQSLSQLDDPIPIDSPINESEHSNDNVTDDIEKNDEGSVEIEEKSSPMDFEQVDEPISVEEMFKNTESLKEEEESLKDGQVVKNSEVSERIGESVKSIESVTDNLKAIAENMETATVEDS